jgi:hypothetical protein
MCIFKYCVYRCKRLLIGERVSIVCQRGTTAIVSHLLQRVCSISFYRISTGSTQFPMVELVDPAGYSQGVKSHNLYSPLHRESLLAIPLQISLVQILIHLDSEERLPILTSRHSLNILLARSHTLTHAQLPLRWQHQEPSIPPRTT